MRPAVIHRTSNAKLASAGFPLETKAAMRFHVDEVSGFVPGLSRFGGNGENGVMAEKWVAERWLFFPQGNQWTSFCGSQYEDSQPLKQLIDKHFGEDHFNPVTPLITSNMTPISCWLNPVT